MAAFGVNSITVLFIVVVVGWTKILESETAPVNKTIEKLADIAIVVDQPCFKEIRNENKTERIQYAGRRLITHLVKELAVGWIADHRIKVAVIVLKSGDLYMPIVHFDVNDAKKVAKEIDDNLGKELHIRNLDCEDRSEDVLEEIRKEIEGIRGRRSFAAKLIVWIHSYNWGIDSSAPKPKLMESTNAPHLTIVLPHYDELLTDKEGAIYNAAAIDYGLPSHVFRNGSDVSMVFHQIRYLINITHESCAIQEIHDPAKCFYDADQKCIYDVTFETSPFSRIVVKGKQQVEFCPKLPPVQKICNHESDQCEKRCKSDSDRDPIEPCDAPCDGTGFRKTRSRLRINNVPLYQNCPDKSEPCEGTPCDKTTTAQERSTSTKTSTDAAAIETSKSTKTEQEIPPWLVGTVVGCSLLVVVLVAVIGACCVKKRQNRRQSAVGGQARQAPRIHPMHHGVGVGDPRQSPRGRAPPMRQDRRAPFDSRVTDVRGTTASMDTRRPQESRPRDYRRR